MTLVTPPDAPRKRMQHDLGTNSSMRGELAAGRKSTKLAGGEPASAVRSGGGEGAADLTKLLKAKIA